MLSLFSTFIAQLTISTVIRIITYAATCAALPVLRRKSGHPPIFRAAAGIPVSIAAVALSLALLYNVTRYEAIVVAVVIVMGVLIYAASALSKRATQTE